MNPMTNIKNTQKISNLEIELGTAGTKNSWHNRYKDSAWIFVGGLPYDLTEGDVICVFSQYGEIVNCNMVRDQKTGKSKGFMFLCYEDQRSTVLAVDNFNGIKILNRSVRVDHVLDYKPPKDNDNDHDLTKLLKTEGCAPKPVEQSEDEDEDDLLVQVKIEKKKKKKKEKKQKKKKSRSSSSSSEDERSRHQKPAVVKKEKFDPGYGDTEPGNRYHGNRDDRYHGDTRRDISASPDRRGRERRDDKRDWSPDRDREWKDERRGRNRDRSRDRDYDDRREHRARDDRSRVEKPRVDRSREDRSRRSRSYSPRRRSRSPRRDRRDR